MSENPSLESGILNPESATLDPESRACIHLEFARAHLGAVDYQIKAAIIELHRTGPHAEKAARMLTALDPLMHWLHSLIRDLGGE